MYRVILGLLLGCVSTVEAANTPKTPLLKKPQTIRNTAYDFEYGPSSNPKALVVLFHGYGANSANLAPLAKRLSEKHPDVLFWVPDGLEPMESVGNTQWFYGAQLSPYPPFLIWAPKGQKPYRAGGDHRQWFSLKGLGLQCSLFPLSIQPVLSSFLEQSIEKASVTFKNQIEHKLAALQGTSATKIPLILGGFSQGALMAMHMGLYALPTAGVLSFSGFYATADSGNPSCSSFLYRPPIFWGHGTEDKLIPLECMHKSTAYLKSRGLSVDILEAKGAHDIPLPVMEKASHWISRWTRNSTRRDAEAP